MTEFDTLLINHLELHKIYENQKQSCEGRKTPETKKESLLSSKQKAEGKSPSTDSISGCFIYRAGTV